MTLSRGCERRTERATLGRSHHGHSGRPGWAAADARAVGQSGRAPDSTQRRRDIGDEEREATVSRADRQRLRALAADFGVSQETVRAVLLVAGLVGRPGKRDG